MNAVVVDHAAPGGLALKTVADPVALPSDVIVRVAATSLNLGEVRRARTFAVDGDRPGWDFAGTIERAEARGGVPVGTRVVGMLNTGAWAEQIAVPFRRYAVLPDTVSFEQAATLPVAGLTALYALEKRGSLLGRRVLVTGASGGVGMFAMQLARLGGAHVTALVHSPGKRDFVARYADEVFVGNDAGVTEDRGSFDIILESVGGDVFASALTVLADDGVLVTFGTSASKTSTIDVSRFYANGGASIYGFILFHEIERQPPWQGLSRLVSLLDAGTIEAHVDAELPIARIGEAADRLWNRSVTGKLVVVW